MSDSWPIQHIVASSGQQHTGYAIQVKIAGRWVTVDHQNHVNGDVVAKSIGRNLAEYTLVNPRPFVPHVPRAVSMVAAAPKMLAALRLCADREDIMDDGLGEVIAAAIAAAEGGVS